MRSLRLNQRFVTSELFHWLVELILLETDAISKASSFYSDL